MKPIPSSFFAGLACGNPTHNLEVVSAPKPTTITQLLAAGIFSQSRLGVCERLLFSLSWSATLCHWNALLTCRLFRRRPVRACMCFTLFTSSLRELGNGLTEPKPIKAGSPHLFILSSFCCVIVFIVEPRLSSKTSICHRSFVVCPGPRPPLFFHFVVFRPDHHLGSRPARSPHHTSGG